MTRTYRITVLKNRKVERKEVEIRQKNIKDDKLKIVSVSNFDKLRTNFPKGDECPQWNMTSLTDKSINPETIDGFVIDYDDETFPKLNNSICYYFHQTHTKKWRIIVPFDKTYNFTDSEDYSNNYHDMLKVMFSTSECSVEELLNKRIIDRSAFSASFFFYFRPKKNDVFKNEGEFYQPVFSTKIGNKDLSFTISKDKYYSVQSKLELFKRIDSLYRHYKHNFDWSLITPKNNKCVFGWHTPDHQSSLKLNTPNKVKPANIHCFHTSCEDKIEDFLKSIFSEEIRLSNSNIMKNKTVKYMFVAIMKGIWSIEMLEYCALRDYRSMRENVKRLQFLKFKIFEDSDDLVNVLFSSSIYSPENGNMYVYKDHVYKKVLNEDILITKCHGAIAPYVSYRTNGKVNVNKYVLDFFKRAKSIFLLNFEKLSFKDHLNLKNGIIIFNDEKYRFIPHTPLYFSTDQMTYEYDEKASCPLWKKCLRDYFGDENSFQAKLLQEYFGYCLTFDRWLEKYLMVFGKSRGGKNTIIQTLMALIPSEQTSMSFFIDAERRGPFIIDKKILFINEVDDFQGKKSSKELNKFASTDNIELKLLYDNAYSTDRVPKLVIGFNNIPDNLKMDKALKNKTLAIKFTKSFMGKENLSLKKELLLERSGILNWALEGYIRLRKTGKFSDNGTDTDYIYQESNDAACTVTIFLKTSKEKKKIWGAKELFEKYQEYTKDFDLTLHQFSKIILELDIPKIRKKSGIFYDLTNFIEV